MNEQVYEELKRVAKAGATTTYGDIAPLVGLDMGNPAHRNEIARVLGEISTFEYRAGRPLLSVVVIQRDKNIPGQGFFKLARQLGAYSGSDDFNYFVTELKKVHAHWA